MDQQHKDDGGGEREGKMIPLTPGQPASDVLYNQHGAEGAISTKPADILASTPSVPGWARQLSTGILPSVPSLQGSRRGWSSKSKLATPSVPL